ncbi:metalloprotease, partial [Trichoderma arundinaceum]
DEALNRQFQVLKTDYAPTGISFSLKSIDKTINETWANNTDLKRMWHTLRKGGYNELNLWFIPTLGNYGFCTLPASSEDVAYAFYEDGCTIRSDTVPGGRAKEYNLGKTVTHEVGHWFGLLHTFEGGCEGEGDYVDDTPAQASPSSGCPEGRDSCPDKPGLDPIHNFMDYSYDACYKEFTPGQVDRMRKVWSGYRAWAVEA